MSILINFTVEEINLLSIYAADTIAATVAAIDGALPDIYDEDIISIAESASRKLSALTEQEFSTLSFPFVDEYEGDKHEISTPDNPQ